MIALDSSSIICLVERVEPANQTILRLLHSHQEPFVASTISLTECLKLPAHKEGLRNDYLKFFDSKELTLLPVDSAVAKAAADLRNQFGLKTADAIHLAAALAHGAQAFVTTDNQDFSRCIGKMTLEIIVLDRHSDLRPNTP